MNEEGVFFLIGLISIYPVCWSKCAQFDLYLNSFFFLVLCLTINLGLETDKIYISTREPRKKRVRRELYFPSLFIRRKIYFNQGKPVENIENNALYIVNNKEVNLFNCLLFF